MIVIPMAGLSSRFSKAGYKKPKFMLETQGKSLFDWSILSFSKYFSSKKFLFILREDQEAEDFVKNRCGALGVNNYHIVLLLGKTDGQAETVYQGLKLQKVKESTAITIFNIDTFRPGYVVPPDLAGCDGYLEVFRGEGNNWSYVKPMEHGSTLVGQTAEKRPISNLCSTGLYFFACAGDYFSAYEESKGISLQNLDANERYIAPLYNFLIEEGKGVHYHEINPAEVVFCGTPEEYINIDRDYSLMEMY